MYLLALGLEYLLTVPEQSCQDSNLFLVSDLSTVVPGSYPGSADLLTLFPSGRDTKLVSNTTIYSSPC